jgi:alanine racemase
MSRWLASSDTLASDVSPSGEVMGKGAVRVLRPRRAAPADAVRPTRAEVNLAHLRHNLRVLERAVALDMLRGQDGSPKDKLIASAVPAKRAAIWGVLKADGYGHGASAVARTLERAGIPALCVALLEEALELRAAGIRIPILVMGGYYGPRREGLHEILAHDFVPVVYNAGHIERFASVARFEGSGRRVRVHLKVDTGMGRLGASAADLDGIFEALKSRPEVCLDGLMTHLACADADSLDPTLEQLRRFQEIEARAHAEGFVPRVRHAANSAAMLRLQSSWLDVVRPGIALFGVAPCAGLAAELRPVMRVRSEVVAVRSIGEGEAIGYGHTWHAPRRSLIATVPMGYADGLDRQLSNRGHALVRGRRAPIVGTVSMDLTMIDVTDVPGAQVGDEAVFLGAQEGPLGRDAISAAEIAEQIGTIPWEVLTSISRRVPRFYREP